MSTTTIDYLRHGRPEGGNRFRGSGVDDLLSDEGWAQMRATAAAIAGWDRVVSSPMQRCRAFAEWIAAQRGVPIEVVHDLREVGFGSWEGATREELAARDSGEYAAFYRDPVHNRPVGAEPLAAFGARVAAVFEALRAAHAGRHLLVVAHAGVIRATLGHVLQAPPVTWYQATVDHAALSRFACDATPGPRTDRPAEPAPARLVTHNWRPAL